MRAQMNKRAFAHTLGGEYGDDSMGLDFGLLGKEGGNLRATHRAAHMKIVFINSTMCPSVMTIAQSHAICTS